MRLKECFLQKLYCRFLDLHHWCCEFSNAKNEARLYLRHIEREILSLAMK